MKFIGGLDTDLSLADITSVVAGTGMTGGATTGAATVNVIGGDGITANADDMAITAAQTTITSIYNASLKLGRDTDNLIDFATTDNKLIFRANNENQIIITDGGIAPVTTNDIDLGSASKEFKDAYFDGTVTSDAFAGPLTGDVEGNAATATSAATVTTAAQPAIESIGTDGDTLTILADELLMSNTTADSPTIKMVNTTDDNEGARLIFEKLRDDNGVAQGQNLGEIWFRGQDGSQNTEDYAYIVGEIDVATHGQESGQLKLGLANHDGGNGNGIILTGGSADNEIDVTVGLGASSVVTIPGDIDLAGDIDVDGTLETDALTVGGTNVLTGSLITTLGTISAGVWNGTAIASAYLDADTAHYSATRQVTHHMITDDIDSDVIYISLGDIDSENTSATSKNLPLIAPTAGKLLKIFLRTSVNYSGETFTWKLYTRSISASTGGSPSEIGAQSGTGPTNTSMVTYDFTSSLDSGTNAIVAGDKVQISIEAADGATANGNYFITCLWEWDLS